MSNAFDPYDLVGAAREAADLLQQLADQHRDLIGPTHARLAAAIALAAPLSKKVWTPVELAKRWQVSAKLVRGLIEDGDLEAFNAGRGTVPHWRITNTQVLQFAERRRKGAALD